MIVKTRKKKITGTMDAAPVFYEVLAVECEEDQAKEHFWSVCLDTKLRIQRIDLISLGILDSTLVHPREVFRPAVSCSASSVVVAHNHPSGDADPSEKDFGVTRKLLEASKVLGIQLLDHIIIGNPREDRTRDSVSLRETHGRLWND